MESGYKDAERFIEGHFMDISGLFPVQVHMQI